MRLYLENQKYYIFNFLIYGRGWIVLQSYGKVRSVRPSPGSQSQMKKSSPDNKTKSKNGFPVIFWLKSHQVHANRTRGYWDMNFWNFIYLRQTAKTSKCHNSVTNWPIELTFWISTYLNRPDIHAKFHQNRWWWGVGHWVIWHGMTQAP